MRVGVCVGVRVGVEQFQGGFAGFGQGVEWCVTGLDRNWAYNPGCKAARP